MLTTIPFSGFYESMHDGKLDRALENMTSDSSGWHPISDKIAEDIWTNVNWGDAMKAYAKLYTENFAFWFKCEYDVALEWESMTSPREYNFTTDRIFCTMSEDDAVRLCSKVKKEMFRAAAKENFTSYDGFISHYSPDWKSWGELRTWDHNQLGTLVKAAVAQLDDENWQWNLIEDIDSNGDVSNLMYEALTDEGKRLVKIADYLRAREARRSLAR
jgi:hypothetical protein